MNPINYEEKRKHPRIVVERPISMVLSAGDILNASLYDISPGGVQVHCDKITAHKFQYEYEISKEKGTTRFRVTFKLAFKDHEEILEALCRMVYILKRDQQDIYAIGVEFTELKGENRNILKKYLESLSA